MKRTKIVRNKEKSNFGENSDIYYVSLGTKPKRWFDINELFELVNKGINKNPITNETLSEIEINKIKSHMEIYIKNDVISKKTDILPIEERLEDIDNKIESLNLNLEDYYSELVKVRDLVELNCRK